MINYNRLLQIYKPDAHYVLHDRTYDGIEWLDKSMKPSKDLFEAWQKEEDRKGNALTFSESEKLKELEEKRHQARVEAQERAKPIQQKIEEEWDSITTAIIELAKKTSELKASLRAKDAVLELWHELDDFQSELHGEAKAYLEETRLYAEKEAETGIPMPEAIRKARNEAFSIFGNGKVVYASAVKLREREMPSREEIIKAYKEGGEILEKMKELIKDIHLKYPKPTRR